jgi:ATP/maltotriose-dependent transcriptional regulator MalT
VSAWALCEQVEAAARGGHPGHAAEALDRLRDATRDTDQLWGLGLEARSRAVLAESEDAFVEAVERLGRTRLRPDTARAHLVYGEWLRRQARRVDARTQLRAAYELFVAIGMEAFAERARRELLATGETVRKRASAPAPSAELTPQERQIAVLVRDGLSNPEVAARLFLSNRTVEWHLRKVFGKLSISSRRQLRDVLPRAEFAPVTD